MAARISKQITRDTKDLKKDVKTFNEDEHSPLYDFESPLTFDAVKDPNGSFWRTLQAAPADVIIKDERVVPFSVK